MASSLQQRRPPPWRVAVLALAASLLMHALLLGLAGGGTASRSHAPGAIRLQAELLLSPAGSAAESPAARPEAAVADSAADSAADPAGAPRPSVVPAGTPGPVAATAAPAQAALPQQAPSARIAEPASGTGGADSRIYAARELDRLPLPLQPLPRAPGGTLRLWLTIDARGGVTAIAPYGAEPLPDASWRERLSAVVFDPALRESRTVRARILLELGD